MSGAIPLLALCATMLSTGTNFETVKEYDWIPNYNQQDATFLDLFISTDAVHVSGGSSTHHHHQEHITVHTASGIVNHLIRESSKQQYWLTISEAVFAVMCP